MNIPHGVVVPILLTRFWLENTIAIFDTIRWQKLRFVVTSAFFGAHRLRGIPAIGERLGTQNVRV